MKSSIKQFSFCILMVIVLSLTLAQCTKVEKGYLSSTMAYSVSQFTVVQGRAASSYSLVSDGSSLPLNIELQHVYDAKGNIVDSMFTKKYPVTVWTAAYNNATDTTFAAITAKRTTTQLPPVIINPKSGVFETNSATVYLPLGSYTFDLKVTNVQGTILLPKIITMNLSTGKPFETTPETGAYAVYKLIANTGTSTAIFNGNNNPYVFESLTRIADTPNRVEVVVTDRNGRAFNPKNNEVVKRPNSGLNPNPPFLQNLQDYAPDTYKATDTSMTLLYPLTPFPIASLGNGYNMYYCIPTTSVQIDTTATWSTNTSGVYYQGTSDSHYKGIYPDGKYDFSFRVPMRIQVPGSYKLRLKILNITHK
ncbi:DUF5007 domain-containing protein [Chitinophagaceae bacterium 26-R-25]|nr:DUF5007 domain-containing protein [Chitinophagaceae bacterium 26-R-25]